MARLKGQMRCALVFAGFVGLLWAASPATKKFDRVAEQLERGRRANRKVTATLTENDLNAYLAENLRETGRQGVNSIRLSLLPDNYISSFTVIDFDAVERWRPGTVPMLLRPVLRGRKAIQVDARFRAEGGKFTYQIEKGLFEKIPIPPSLMEKVIEIVASRQPERYDVNRPIPLPPNVQRVWTSQGMMTVEN